MNTIDYFKNNREEMPKWLKDYKIGDRIDLDVVFKHRIVYYPGANVDGQPVKTYNKAHFAHTFFYVDYKPTREETYNNLCMSEAFLGYKLLDIKDISEKDFTPKGWTPHIIPTKEEQERARDYSRDIKPYCFIAIYERKEKYDDSHGDKRIALIYLFADGIATYDAVFANYNRKPAILVLQDHGFGGNYNYFGNGGYLEKIAKLTNTYPEYILSENNSNMWDGYEMVYNVECEIGGMWANHRHLFKKTIK